RLEGAGAHGHPLDPGDGDGRRLAGGAMSFDTLDQLLFAVLAATALVSALYMILQRNPTYSAFSFIVTLCSISAIYGLLGSSFIAVLQLVVYAGAIMVL